MYPDRFQLLLQSSNWFPSQIVKITLNFDAVDIDDDVLEGDRLYGHHFLNHDILNERFRLADLTAYAHTTL